MKLVSVCLASLLAIPVLTTATAHAQSASAEALFKEGKELIKRGKLAAGCDKLEASEQVESSTGTLLNLGDCREKLGETASAWAAFTKAEATARRAGNDEKRRAEAEKRAAALEPKLTRFTIKLSNPPVGTTIHLNDDVIDSGAWNTPLPVDPATYKITVSAPGYETWTTSVTLPRGARDRAVSIPALVPAPMDGSPPPIVETRTPVVQTTTRAKTWSTTRGVAVGVGIAGAAAVGTGIFFGLRATSLRQDSDVLCPFTLCNDTEGLRLNDEAQDAAMRANIFYAAGGVALAGAAVLWVVGKPDGETVITPAVSRESIGASITGRF